MRLKAKPLLTLRDDSSKFRPRGRHPQGISGRQGISSSLAIQPPRTEKLPTRYVACTVTSRTPQPNRIEIVVPEKPTFVDSSQGIFSATALQTVSIDDIIATDGARSPAVDTSQKNFRAIVVVITDDPLSDDRVASYDSDIGRFSQNGQDTSS